MPGTTTSTPGSSNWGPRSEIISCGISWRQKTRCTRRLAVSKAEGRGAEMGNKLTDLENQSTMMRITLLPSDGSRLVTNSTAMRPGVMRYGQGMEEVSWSLMRGFTAGTARTGGVVLSRVSSHGQPHEMLPQ